MAGATRIVIDGVSYPVDDATAVDFEEQQTLTDAQKELARENIGAASAADVASIQSAIGNVPSGSTLQGEKAPIITDTASGSIASFPDGADSIPMKSLVCSIEPAQEGSGDPSPDNVRPFTGFTGMNVNHSGADTTNPDVLPISWEAEAGTVYGGELDVTSGVLTVNKRKASLTGNESWSLSAGTSSSARRFIAKFDWTSWGGSAVNYSSHFKYVPFSEQANAVWGEYNTTSDKYVKIFDKYRHFETVDAFTDWLKEQVTNNTPVQFIYNSNRPVTYQLTSNQLNTLLGTNNVWCDTGDTTAEYRADTKLFIQKVNAPTDDDMVADSSIASGQYFLINNTLFLSTTTIPAGDTINPGTNCIKTDLAAALNAINA